MAEGQNAGEGEDEWPVFGAFTTVAGALGDLGIDFEAVNVRRANTSGATPAFALWVSIPDDMRMASRAAPRFSFWYQVFHETGHVVHGSSVGTPWAILKGYEYVPGAAATAFAEAGAQLVTDLLDEPAVLRRHTTLSEERISGLSACTRDIRLFSLRWQLGTVAFERALYEDGGATDPDLLARAADARYLRVATPDDAPDVGGPVPARDRPAVHAELRGRRRSG